MDVFDEADWYKGMQPIAVIENGIVAIKKSRIIKVYGKKKVILSFMHRSFKERIMECNRISRRLFRRDVRCSCITSSKELLFFKSGRLYKLGLLDGGLRTVWEVPKGYSTPLNITRSIDKNYLAYWGDYFNNPHRNSVKIYGLTTEGKVNEVYSFPRGSVRHIHNIIQDESGGYYVFAGDNDMQAGIYHATNKFRNVVPIYTGDGQARAVVGFAFNGGILYATDSVDEVNHIYYLCKNHSGEWTKEAICMINGSCIYGTKFGERYVFSTTVEPPESNGSVVELFSRKRGTGILSEDVELISIGKELDVNWMGKRRKDCLPYKLFQYGSIRFANNDYRSDIMVVFPMAVKGRDCQMGIVQTC